MSRNKGFTLIELLVVIAIIGILASIILVNLGSTRKQARDVSAISSMSSIRAAAEVFFSINNTYVGADVAAGDVDRLLEAVNTQLGAKPVFNEDQYNWEVHAVLSSSGGMSYCVDSTGFAGKMLTTAVPVSGDLTCL